jgi:hypothetical protein
MLTTLIEKTIVSTNESNKKVYPLMKIEINTNKQRKVRVADLVYLEASIAVLEELVNHFECLINQRLAQLKQGSHFGKVERKIDELTLSQYKHLQNQLKLTRQSWGTRPYEDFIHEGEAMYRVKES